jgi:long-subunit fatty acid transport protein
MLFVPDGCEAKLNPEALAADHLIVTGLLASRPAEPGGLVTAERPVAGPSQRMSNDTVAATDAGVWNRNSALGMLKKSRTPRFATAIRAVPAPRWTVTASDGSGTVQNNPCG